MRPCGLNATQVYRPRLAAAAFSTATDRLWAPKRRLGAAGSAHPNVGGGTPSAPHSTLKLPPRLTLGDGTTRRVRAAGPYSTVTVTLRSAVPCTLLARH